MTGTRYALPDCLRIFRVGSSRFDMVQCNWYKDYMRYAQIPDFTAYRVSSEGFVESRWRSGAFYNGFKVEDKWKRMRHNERPDGYQVVDLRDGYGNSRRAYVHILIAEAFIGEKPFERAVVRHLNGDSSNNAVSNLAWGTYQQNEDDKRNHGTWDSRYGGKLTAVQREAIKNRASKGESQRLLAEEFEVSRPTITRLVNGSTWRSK